MAILKTATEKEFSCNFLGVAGAYSTLFAKVDMQITTVLEIFQDPNETKELIWIGDTGDIVRTEKGFTEFVGFTIVGGECPIRVQMQKPTTDELTIT